MNKVIDLRSDTASQPTPEVREAVLSVPMGDDLLREDETTNTLLTTFCQMLGMEDALLSSSGTMSNQIAIKALTKPGDEILLGPESHILNLEAAGTAANSHVQTRDINVHRGQYDPQDIESSVFDATLQRAPTSVVCLESSYDLNSGYVTTLENLREIRRIADKFEIPIFMDGARVLNAACTLEVELREICQYVDAVHVSLNKGLGAPIGSILAGSGTFIRKSRRIRQRLGGGIRHTGFMAAPALVTLDNWRDRLERDHRLTSHIANHLDSKSLFTIINQPVETNIVCVGLNTDQIEISCLIKFLKTENILVKQVSQNAIRLVVHQTITSEDVQETIRAFDKFMESYHSNLQSYRMNHKSS
ncbi:MAG: aminotransferase class I/II-fold pyridoxal phosphate-dependent enzyme [Alteromonadaceae bacterium]|nr:aminotransferase class I/II-fold pyridoxal phosphate-dependent enzyme [Alteromonadaceae bacterium]